MEKRILIYFLAITLILSGTIAYVISKQTAELINVKTLEKVEQRFGAVTSTGNFPTSLTNPSDSL